MSIGEEARPIKFGSMNSENIIREDGDNFEPGSHRDFGTYDVEVMNGDGYYDEEGWFHRYRDVD